MYRVRWPKRLDRSNWTRTKGHISWHGEIIPFSPAFLEAMKRLNLDEIPRADRWKVERWQAGFPFTVLVENIKCLKKVCDILDWPKDGSVFVVDERPT